uniref:Laminin G domain-containing protein n=1 Tax=Arion vulgaris TaxID=1028688 RepID=A0A0B7AGG2_9EUPU
MDLLFSVVFLCLLAVLTDGQARNEGPCFDFHGNSYLHFNPNIFDNNDNIHFSLQFKTTLENGIILYSRGLQGDDEALYIRNGKLRYHLFNTSPTGVEGYYGAYMEGDETVNIDDWIKVDIYRHWSYVEPPQRRPKRKTGFEVEIGGDIYRHIDHLDRRDISLQPTIYLGGFRESLSETVFNFTGQIKDVYEEKNRVMFENPSGNFLSRVSLSCIGNIAPV